LSTEPTVSIVLPTYDGSRYLDQALASCLEQSFRDLELIAVDDGSSDATAEILAACARRDPRLVILRNPHNQGLSASLNRGFGIARGRYLTWTSDDNQYRPHALATMLAHLEARPDTDLVYADHTVLDENTGAEEARRCEPVESLAEVNVVQACFLFRRGLLERVGRYDEALPCAEDYDYWLRARAAGCRMEPLHQDLYVYRLHGESLTERRFDDARRGKIHTLSRHLPLLPDLTRAQRARGYLRLAELCRDLGDLTSFRRFFLQALAAAPWVPLRRWRSRRLPLLNFVTFLCGIRFTEGLRRLRHRARREP
jgi:glycosyltransferase involved in cell wall biosynthesis